MRAALSGLVFVLGCGGVLAHDDAGSSQDASVVPPSKDSGSPFKDASLVDTITPDVIAVDATPCTETLCNGLCVDTQSDPDNCGTCANICDSGTCNNGACTNANEPPLGTCTHSLCEIGAALVEGCDPCTTTICAQNGVPADTFCCLTSWDNLCTQEVGTYCAPYSCN